MLMNTLVVSNNEQKVLWDTELAGQISDGVWENATPQGHYQDWFCEVVVGEKIGRNFYALKSNYNFTRPDLLKVVGNRMLTKVRVSLLTGITDTRILDDVPDDLADYCRDIEIADQGRDHTSNYFAEKILRLWEAGIDEGVMYLAENHSYGMKELKKDLSEIKKACKTQL